jgi:hypothetical protein
MILEKIYIIPTFKIEKKMCERRKKIGVQLKTTLIPQHEERKW